MTKAERAHYGHLAALGCIVCRRLGYPDSPAEVHHTKIGITGAGRKSDYLSAIPLCVWHHRIGVDAYHYAPRTWESRFGTQSELLDYVQTLLTGGRAA